MKKISRIIGIMILACELVALGGILFARTEAGADYENYGIVIDAEV